MLWVAQPFTQERRFNHGRKETDVEEDHQERRESEDEEGQVTASSPRSRNAKWPRPTAPGLFNLIDLQPNTTADYPPAEQENTPGASA
jgi:hypothetical protein